MHQHSQHSPTPTKDTPSAENGGNALQEDQPLTLTEGVVAMDSTPAYRMEPKREAWTSEELKRFRQVARQIEENHRKLNLLLQCSECGELVHFEASKGGIVLVCPCTTREVI